MIHTEEMWLVVLVAAVLVFLLMASPGGIVPM